MNHYGKKGELKMTQCEKILKFMDTHKNGITPLQAMDKFGCMRLTSRIHDLREQGYNISSESVEVKNRYGEKCRVSRYRLVK